MPVLKYKKMNMSFNAGSPRRDSKEKVILEAITSYYPTDHSQLTMTVGDIFTLVRDDKAAGMCVVMSSGGECGLVPSSMLMLRVCGVGSPTLRRARAQLHNFDVFTHEEEHAEETTSPPLAASPSSRPLLAEKRHRVKRLQMEVEEKRQKIQSLAAQQRVAKRSLEEFTKRVRDRKEDLEDAVVRFEELKVLPPMAPSYPLDPAQTVTKKEEEMLKQKRLEKRKLMEEIAALSKKSPGELIVSPTLSVDFVLQLPNANPKFKALALPKNVIKKVVKVRREVVQAVDPVVQRVVNLEGYTLRLTEFLATADAESVAVEARVQSLLAAIEECELKDSGNKNAVKMRTYESEAETLRVNIATAEKTASEHTSYIENAEAVIAKLTKHAAKLERKLQEGKGQNHEMQRNLAATLADVTALKEGATLEEAALGELKSERARLKTQIAEIAKKVEGAAAEYKVELTAATTAYKKEEQRRRELYNELQELKGNIRVYCRLKPRSATETCEFIKQFDDMNLDVYDELTGRDNRFEFDVVLAEDASQESIFTEVQPLALSILDGYHVCIFAYGQTGSGKTFTMEGPPNNRGVNVRAVDELFRSIASRKDDYTYTIDVSVLEVYNDVAYDLQNKRMKLEVRHSEKTGVVIEGLVKVPATKTDDVVDVLTAAYAQRVAKATSMNERSSRSHCIVSLFVTGINLATNQKLIGKLHMIDLAGSERIKQSEATGDRLKEATFINQSLTSLGLVIRALASKKDHVPYRDSKLTAILQDSLGGNCKCLMFANISMANSNVPETVSTLKFATNARKVELGRATANKA